MVRVPASSARRPSQSSADVRASLSLATLRELLLRAPAPERQPHDDEEPAAAVALVLREGPAGAELLFIRRAERAGDPWSGHVAFPGGRRDAADDSLLRTAVRETREEIGLPLDEQGAELLTPLPAMHARAGGKRLSFSIAPFVFALHDASAPLVPDPREVDEVLWVPVERLASGEGRSVKVIEHDGVRHELPAQLVGAHVLWGLSYAMMESLFGLVPPLRALHSAARRAR